MDGDTPGFPHGTNPAISIETLTEVSNTINNLSLAMQPDYLEEVRRDRDDTGDDVEVELTEEQKASGIELCDRFFDWIISLPTLEHLETINFDIADPPYPIEDVVLKLFTPDESAEWLKVYQSGMSMDDMEEKFDKDAAVLILGLVNAIWTEQNASNNKLEPLIKDASIDIVTLRAIRNYLSTLNVHHNPMDLLHKVLLPPTDVSVALLIIRCRLSGWPCTINWDEVVFDEIPRDEYEKILTTLEDQLNNAFTREAEVDENEVDEISEACENMEKWMSSFTSEVTKLKNASAKLAEENQTWIRNHKKNEDLNSKVDLYPENLSRSPPRSMDEVQKLEMELRQLEQEAAAINTPDFTENQDLAGPKKSAFTVGKVVWARKQALDSEPLERGTLMELLSDSRFSVQFEDGRLMTVDAMDIAVDAPNMTEFFEGLRVAAKVSHPYPLSGREDQALGYYSGTISNRPNSLHNYQYLVFFDDDFDEYVSKEDIKIMAQQAVDKGRVDKSLTHKFIRSPKKREFVEIYFKTYPDWGLVRLKKHEQNQRIAVRHRNGQQWSAIVLEVDRHMCLLRFPPLISKSAPGAQCIVKDCRLHYHVDERLYRGSDRFLQVQQNIANHHQGQAVHQGRQWHRHRAMLESAVPVAMQVEMGKSGNNMRRPTCRKSTMNIARGDVALAGSELRRRSEKDLAAMRRKMHEFELVNHYVHPNADPLPAFHLQCSNDCLKGRDRDPVDSSFGLISPFHIPMMCGWKRLIYTPQRVANARKNLANKPMVCYRGPCGKPLYNMEEVSDYLKVTRSQMTIDLFTLDPEVRTHIIAKVDERYQMRADFACGKEAMPIPVVNTLDNDPPPEIMYNRGRFAENDEVDISTVRREFCSGCSCTDDCRDEARCECQQLTRSSVRRLCAGLRPNGAHNYRYRRIQRRVASGIYECNDACQCNKKRCHNRVVQQPIKIPIQMFKTAECGWGVRSLVDLPRGCFIANYNGAILTDHLADNLKDRGDEYFAELDMVDCIEMDKTNCGIDLLDDKGVSDLRGESDDEKSRESRDDSDGYETGEDSNQMRERVDPQNGDAQQQPAGFGAQWSMETYFGEKYLFIVDAKKRGNIGRFLNHSCDPNVFVQHVFVDTHDIRLPWVSFFTMKNVKAGEELRWDYAYAVDESTGVRMHCRCGTKNCRLRLL